MADKAEQRMADMISLMSSDAGSAQRTLKRMGRSQKGTDWGYLRDDAERLGRYLKTIEAMRKDFLDEVNRKHAERFSS